MKRLLLLCGKAALFIALWLIAISLPLALWASPSLLADWPPLLRLWWELLPLAGTILVTLLFTQLIERRHPLPYLFPRRRAGLGLLKGFAAGLIYAGGVAVASVLVGALLPGRPQWSAFMPIWVLALLLNTVMQELAVRGPLFSLLERDGHPLAAVAVTSLLFLLLHGGGALFSTPLALVNLLAVSLVFGLVRLYTGSLWAVTALHFAWNLTLGLGLGVLGLPGDYPALFPSLLQGPALLTGGTAGLEGSLLTLAATCIFLGLLFTRPALRRTLGFKR